MKVGFTLKQKKRPATAGNASSLGGFRVEKVAAPAPDKALVVGFGTSGQALLKDPVAAKAPLVIPLIQQNWTSTTTDAATDADQAAADALLADIRSTTGGAAEAAEASTLVIPAAAKPVPMDGKDAPILFQNKLPGADQFTNENDKFKHDIALRPAEMDIHSDAYAVVPIEEFGAALLRGMGWSGKERVKPTGSQVAMRHQRLGLGATPKPPVEGDAKKKRGKPTIDMKPLRLVEKKVDRPRDPDGDGDRHKNDDSVRRRDSNRDSNRDVNRDSSREVDRDSNRESNRDSRASDDRRQRSRSRDRRDRSRDRTSSKRRSDSRDRKRRSRDRPHRRG